jgi:hypothetical protein
MSHFQASSKYKKIINQVSFSRSNTEYQLHPNLQRKPHMIIKELTYQKILAKDQNPGGVKYGWGNFLIFGQR